MQINLLATLVRITALIFLHKRGHGTPLQPCHHDTDVYEYESFIMIRCKQQAKVDIPFHARLRTRTRPRLVVLQKLHKATLHYSVLATSHQGDSSSTHRPGRRCRTDYYYYSGKKKQKKGLQETEDEPSRRRLDDSRGESGGGSRFRPQSALSMSSALLLVKAPPSSRLSTLTTPSSASSA